MKKKNLNIPNILSASRLFCLPLLFILLYMRLDFAFLVTYIIVGSTDFFDGLIARRFNMKTELGKKLDSFADIFFYVSTAWFVAVLFPDYLAPNYLLLIVFFCLFFLSFVISAIFCRKPIMMHTFLLRLNAVLVYFLVILSFLMDTTWMITGILVIYFVGFVEEILIFILYGEVDADTPSILHLIHEKKPKEIENK